LDLPGPVYIRLGKGGDPVVSRDEDGFEIGRAIELRGGADVAIVATGVMVGRALDAAEILAGKGIQCTVVNMHTVKPIDRAKILELAQRFGLIVTLEEHTVIGGLGSAVAEVLVDEFTGKMPQLKRLGIPDSFPSQYGSQDSLLEYFGLQPDTIAAAVAAHAASSAAAE
ncbi:MAG: transketolase C-terminal domain-containing protein, partial [Rhodospirillaceae bacterium]